MPIGEEGGEEGGRRGVWREGSVLTESRVDEGARVIFWHRLFSSLLRTKVFEGQVFFGSKMDSGE